LDEGEKIDAARVGVCASEDLFMKFLALELFLGIDGIGQGVIGPVLGISSQNLNLRNSAQLSKGGVLFGPRTTSGPGSGGGGRVSYLLVSHECRG
jgi:hypothetical protein